MGRQSRIPILLLTLGLVALGIAAGTQQGAEDGPNGLAAGSTLAVFLGATFVGSLLIFVATWVWLCAVLPTGMFRPMSQREGLLGGILMGVLLVIGFINFCAGDAERSRFFVPLLLLNAVGISGAYFFLTTCIGHVLTQDRPVRFKALWVALLVLGNLVAMPLYWCLFVWRPSMALPSGGKNNAPQP
jgi:hypothetical protein